MLETELDFLLKEKNEAIDLASSLGQRITDFGRTQLWREKNNLTLEKYDTNLTTQWEEAAEIAKGKMEVFNSAFAAKLQEIIINEGD